MATAYHNLSDYDFNSVPDASEMRFGIVVSEWNSNITGPLLEGAVKTLKTHGAKDKNILVQTVPGSFELTFGSAQMIQSGKVDVNCDPLSQVDFTIPYDLTALPEKECVLIVSFINKYNHPWCEAGYEQSFDQFIIKKAKLLTIYIFFICTHITNYK